MSKKFWTKKAAIEAAVRMQKAHPTEYLQIKRVRPTGETPYYVVLSKYAETTPCAIVYRGGRVSE